MIVLNDQSEDETAELLQAHASQTPGFSYLEGQPLPAGWLGKNWACHQLAQQASGKYLLFFDADVAFLHPELVSHTLGTFQRHSLTLLSLFPNQEMNTFGEKLVVPIMHYLLLSLLPLHAVFRLSSPQFAAANGQFMMFEATNYQNHLWHQQVKQEVIEDIAIMKAVKRAGQKGKVLLANGFISYRMYRNLKEGVQGFSKNLLAGFGNSIPGLMIYLLLEIIPLFILPFFLSFPLIILGESSC